MAETMRDLVQFMEQGAPLMREYDDAKAELVAHRDDPKVRERWNAAKHNYSAFRTSMKQLAGRPTGTSIAGGTSSDAAADAEGSA